MTGVAAFAGRLWSALRRSARCVLKSPATVIMVAPGIGRTRVDAEHVHRDERASQDRARRVVAARTSSRTRRGSRSPAAARVELTLVRWRRTSGIEPVDRGVVLIDEGDVAQQ